MALPSTVNANLSPYIHFCICLLVFLKPSVKVWKVAPKPGLPCRPSLLYQLDTTMLFEKPYATSGDNTASYLPQRHVLRTDWIAHAMHRVDRQQLQAEPTQESRKLCLQTTWRTVVIVNGLILTACTNTCPDSCQHSQQLGGQALEVVSILVCCINPTDVCSVCEYVTSRLDLTSRLELTAVGSARPAGPHTSQASC